jgi:hypothetical protein
MGLIKGGVRKPQRSKVAAWLILAVPAGLGVASLFFLRRGTADRSEGLPAVARVERLGEGSCVFGAKRETCQKLYLRVLPDSEPAFQASLDVLVPDRFASRVQPGSYLWVVRDRREPERVALALEAFGEPAPAPPAAPSAAASPH